MKFKVQSSKFKISIVVFILVLFGISFTQAVRADAVTDNALNFLRAKQDAQGRITTGFSAPSQWSAIAFAVHGVDVATVKAADKSLLEFLLTDLPTNNSATDWETRILAIVAIGQNPTSFNGTNYVSNLETFYTNGQLGDTCSLNDDIFGLLALVSAGNTASSQTKQDTLNFLITHQDSDGGFGFSAPGCDFYSTSADMTGAAIQALVAARSNGLTHGDLDNAIADAKAYLLANQDADGGFGYFGSSDTDTTGWVLQAFNVLGEENSSVAQAARTYLLSQQSGLDGGFMAFDWGTSTFVSNATTTAQAVIALSGKGWIVKVFDLSTDSGQVPTSALIPTATPTSIPAPVPSTSSGSTATPTVTLTPTVTPTSAPTPLPAVLADAADETEFETQDNFIVQQPTATPMLDNESETEVLGATDEKKDTAVWGWFFAGLGVIFIFIYLARQFIITQKNK